MLYDQLWTASNWLEQLPGSFFTSDASMVKTGFPAAFGVFFVSRFRCRCCDSAAVIQLRTLVLQLHLFLTRCPQSKPLPWRTMRMWVMHYITRRGWMLLHRNCLECIFGLFCLCLAGKVTRGFERGQTSTSSLPVYPTPITRCMMFSACSTMMHSSLNTNSHSRTHQGLPSL